MLSRCLIEREKKKITLADDGGQGPADEIFHLPQLRHSRAVHVQLQWERADRRGATIEFYFYLSRIILSRFRLFTRK